METTGILFSKLTSVVVKMLNENRDFAESMKKLMSYFILGADRPIKISKMIEHIGVFVKRFIELSEKEQQRLARRGEKFDIRICINFARMFSMFEYMADEKYTRTTKQLHKEIPRTWFMVLCTLNFLNERRDILYLLSKHGGMRVFNLLAYENPLSDNLLFPYGFGDDIKPKKIKKGSKIISICDDHLHIDLMRFSSLIPSSKNIRGIVHKTGFLDIEFIVKDGQIREKTDKYFENSSEQCFNPGNEIIFLYDKESGNLPRSYFLIKAPVYLLNDGPDGVMNWLSKTRINGIKVNLGRHNDI